MKLAPECRDCLKNKIRDQSGYIVKDPARIEEIVRICDAVFAAESKKTLAAAVVSGAMHRRNYAEIGCPDPYAEIKKRDNLRAEKIVEAVAPRMQSLHDWMKASIIGNAMDYGVTGHNVAEDFTRFFDGMFAKELAIDDSDKFFPLARRVVYFTDNCGEVMFDKKFCEALRAAGAHVTVVVKDQPMLNDVTQKEAAEIALGASCDKVCHGGGGAQLGTHPPFFPEKTADAVKNATLIIAKGLANYESLTEYKLDKPAAFLMMIKCDAVGRMVGAKKGDMVAILQEPKA
ncbi:MAG TPA: ARMT1-like domain-containing protein [Methanocorpusculum sp.]|nr:ARMT1-like domain-containing protein [Methanocorpusculum sp.]